MWRWDHCGRLVSAAQAWRWLPLGISLVASCQRLSCTTLFLQAAQWCQDDGCHFEVTGSCLFITREQDPCRETQVSGVTGNHTNDGPTLKMADVSFSIAITSTEVAKEASFIIHRMNVNFASIIDWRYWYISFLLPCLVRGQVLISPPQKLQDLAVDWPLNSKN